MSHHQHKSSKLIRAREDSPTTPENICPVCGAKLIQEKCKVVCRSPQCVYRIIYNCSEF